MRRLQLRAAAHFELENAAKLVRISALKLAYYRSQLSTEFAAPILTLSIGCLRAVTFGDLRAVVWLDVSPMAVWVIAVHLLTEMLLVEAAVFVAERKGVTRFEFVDRPAGHPVGNTALRAFDLKGYALVGMIGCTFLYAIFLCFLGPAFVTGVASTFDQQNLDTWIMSRHHPHFIFNATTQLAHPINVSQGP
jgi:hypothetical protein